MSTPASRQRQRQRRHARERLWAAQKILADRHVDLVSYDRVLADMGRCYRSGQLPPSSGSQAVSLVQALRDATKSDCDRLAADVMILERACKKLEPAESHAMNKEAR